jgi:HAMP domain-containing protein
MDRVGSVLRARRRPPEEPRTYRLGSSIRLPWGLGLACLLLVAMVVGALVGRIDEEEFRVPDAVLRYQETVTNIAAESVRKSINEGVDDLVEFSGVVAGLTSGAPPGAPDEIPPPDKLGSALKSLGDVHGRYTALYVLDSSGAIVVSVGDQPLPELLQPGPPYQTAGTLPARERPGEAGGVLIQQYAPLQLGIEPDSVIAHYDPQFLSSPLQAAAPGEAWVVNRQGRVIASIEGAGFVQLPRQSLRDAAGKALNGETGVVHTSGSIDEQEIIGYAPVTGPGSGGQLGWVVVTSRSVSGLELPGLKVRAQGILAGLAIGVLALLIFGWLYAVVIWPTLRLQAEAERLAYGDLSKPVQIIRYDEIGLVARALERMRVLLIRKKVHAGGPGRTASETDGSPNSQKEP